MQLQSWDDREEFGKVTAAMKVSFKLGSKFGIMVPYIILQAALQAAPSSFVTDSDDLK